MPADPGDGAFAHELRVAVLRLARRMRTARVDTSLSLSQLSALAVLDTQGPMTPGDLAAIESVQPPTLSKVLGVLVERELVERRPHPQDGRAVVLIVTPAGHAAIDAERAARDAWLNERLDRLPGGDRERLAELVPLLEKVADVDPGP